VLRDLVLQVQLNYAKRPLLQLREAIFTLQGKAEAADLDHWEGSLNCYPKQEESQEAQRNPKVNIAITAWACF
jgi:hypothetical protein